MRQVLRPGALGRPRGIGWRGRWEGGLGRGIHVYPWLIHVNVWQKPLQYCKVISLQLKKKKEEEDIQTANGHMRRCSASLIVLVVQTFSRVWLSGTPWIAARQASLSITVSWSSLKLTSIESVMPSNHIISVALVSSCSQSFPASLSFPMSQLFISMAKVHLEAFWRLSCFLFFIDYSTFIFQTFFFLIYKIIVCNQLEEIHIPFSNTGKTELLFSRWLT